MAKNEKKRTIAFVCFGIGMCLLAALTQFMTRPNNSSDFELVGQPFFEEFETASQAKSLEVAALNPDTIELNSFSVAEKDGIWRIPSHYNYPAEAAERLASTATSVMGIERESLVGRLSSDHERFGVVDPLSVEARDPESTGKRITLKDADDEPLVDFIIGKEAGDVEVPMAERAMHDGPAEKYYYVRRPDETQTYKVRLNVDLSTRFSDWIEPDLLKLDKSQLRRISIDNYELKEKGGLTRGREIYKVQGDQLTLSRDDGFGKWTIEGLSEETEELVNERVSEIEDVLDEMKIAGVRPKFKYKDQLLLTPDLKINQLPELQQNQAEFNRAVSRLQSELSRRGFNFIQAPELTLVSTDGELVAGTEDGVVYSLSFGKSVEGDEAAIEIGGAEEKNTKDDKSSPDESQEADDEEPQANTGSDEPESEKTETGDGTGNETEDEQPEARNRYLMIRVSFDESLLGEKPSKPVVPTKPVEPEGFTPPNPEEQTTNTETKAASDSEKDKPEGDEAPAPAPKQEPVRDPAFVAYDEALKEYQQKSTEYTLNLTRYENDLKAFEARVESGKKRVDELNERFGSWYYVISADNLKSMKSTRADVVSQKQKPVSVDKTDGLSDVVPERPDISFEMPDAESQRTEDAPAESPESAPDGDGKKDEEAATNEKKTEGKPQAHPPDQEPPGSDKNSGDDRN